MFCLCDCIVNWPNEFESGNLAISTKNKFHASPKTISLFFINSYVIPTEDGLAVQVLGVSWVFVANNDVKLNVILLVKEGGDCVLPLLPAPTGSTWFVL